MGECHYLCLFVVHRWWECMHAFDTMGQCMSWDILRVWSVLAMIAIFGDLSIRVYVLFKWNDCCVNDWCVIVREPISANEYLASALKPQVRFHVQFSWYGWLYDIDDHRIDDHMIWMINDMDDQWYLPVWCVLWVMCLTHLCQHNALVFLVMCLECSAVMNW